jgi:hypothetical protein
MKSVHGILANNVVEPLQFFDRPSRAIDANRAQVGVYQPA